MRIHFGANPFILLEDIKYRILEEIIDKRYKNEDGVGEKAFRMVDISCDT